MKPWIENALICAAIVAVTFVLPGCAQMFTSKTEVSVETTPDGRCIASYTSDKQQEGLEASICGGSIRTAQSGTLESVVAATMQTQALVLQLMQQLMAGAKAGALSGS